LTCFGCCELFGSEMFYFCGCELPGLTCFGCFDLLSFNGTKLILVASMFLTIFQKSALDLLGSFVSSNSCTYIMILGIS
jgi:hypothetical protein